MMRWCAYCQQFMGETAPYDDYRITHGICVHCAPGYSGFGPGQKAGLARLQAFYLDLREIALYGSSQEVDRVLAEVVRLGIRPVDFLVGMLQPLLEELGGLWAEGRVTVATEHRFSAVAGQLVRHFRDGQAPGPDRPARLLLFNAAGNRHTLGLQMAELYLTAAGIPAWVVPPETSGQDLLALLDQHRPAAAGFSVALPHQLEQVRATSKALERLDGKGLPVLVGGPAVRLGLPRDPGLKAHFCREIREVPGWLARHPAKPG